MQILLDVKNRMKFRHGNSSVEGMEQAVIELQGEDKLVTWAGPFVGFGWNALYMDTESSGYQQTDPRGYCNCAAILHYSDPIN